jgi:hypothetical protein
MVAATTEFVVPRSIPTALAIATPLGFEYVFINPGRAWAPAFKRGCERRGTTYH